jgi:transcriptional regulator with XRE-family HTH domain
VRKTVDSDNIKILGKRIARVRKKQNFTQEELAHKADLTLSQIARIETGVINTSINTLYILSSALEIDIIEFFKKDN